jgi:hypothetical protein
MTEPTAPAASLDELLALQDEAFVRCAYKTLLRREVDSSGLASYLAEVRRGVDLETVVFILAASAEGQYAAPDLPGLPTLMSLRGRKPTVWSRALKHIGSELLRPLESRIRASDNRAYRHAESTAAGLAQLEASMAKLQMAIDEVALKQHGLAAGSSNANPAPPPPPGLELLPPRARDLYRRLRANTAKLGAQA